MGIGRYFIYTVFFILGALTLLFSGYIFNAFYEYPFSFNNLNIDSPSNFLSEKDIEVYPEFVLIRIENASIGRYAPTGSMLPVLSERANGIKIKPKTIDNINIGDIVTFRENNILIIHRIVDKGEDEKGVYFVTKGDNNGVIDGIIRFEDIDSVIVGIIY